MDKIQKFLKALNKKELELMLLLLQQLKVDFKKIPGMIKLKGFHDLYRVRMNNYRIIFKVSKNDIQIMKISKRNESTYKNL
jgi:mRNA-degrading endonuclease RelE of RelBE toxin-antitoxin system